jgi:hypothetical protein
MNVDKVRNEFESRFPVPNGVIWSDGAYHLVNEKACTKLSHLFYLGRWETWQASREALVIELPKIVDKEWANTHAERSAMREAIGWCKKRIEAAGLKVKS